MIGLLVRRHAALLVLLTVASAAVGGADVRTTARPLRQLAKDATLVVVADVVRTEPYDEDRLHVYRLRVLRTLRGTPGVGDLGVVDVRGDSHRPAVMIDGEHLVAFLRPAARLTYLTQHLGDAPNYELLGRRDAVVPIAHDEDAELTAAIVQTALDDALTEDAAIAARRDLARRALGSSSPRLLQDALTEFAALPGWPPLTDNEVVALRAPLQNHTLPPVVRVELLRLLATRKATQTLSAVTSAETETPELLEAVLAARVAMGAPANAEEIARYLESEQPGVRMAAARALALQGDATAVATVGRLATTDRDTAVRAAAIDALGATGSSSAVPIVAQTFDGEDRDIRQHAGRALLALGGDAADQSFIDLALRGKSVDTQRYAALLLVVLRGRDSPAVRRLLASQPNAEVRDVIEHGLQFQHMHEHE